MMNIVYFIGGKQKESQLGYYKDAVGETIIL